MTTPLSWFDIGVNLMDKRFDADREQVVGRAHAAGVEGLLITGTDVANSALAAGFSDRYNRALLLAPSEPTYLASTAGVHPHNADALSDTTATTLAKLLRKPHVRAVGECGLDFNRNFSSPAKQRRAFQMQIELASDCGLPLFVHDRDSNGEVASLLEQSPIAPDRVVVHCFTGDAQTLATYRERGYYVGITGWVTDPKRGEPLSALLSTIPQDRLLLETDAPYLWPRNAPTKPKSGRNEPSYLPWVAEYIAQRCGIELATLAANTTANARRLFFE